MKKEYRITFGKRVRLLTILLLAVMAIAAFVLLRAIVRLPDSEALTTGAILFVILCAPVATLCFVPRRLILTRQVLIIKRVVGSVRIARKDIVSVTPRQQTGGDLRLFGSGGFFGYIGHFRNSKEGKYFAYVTNVSQMFWVVTRRKKYLLSCEHYLELIDTLNKEAKS